MYFLVVVRTSACLLFRRRNTMNMCHECLPLCPPLWPFGLQPTRLFCPWNFFGKSTSVDCHFLLQGIFPIQGRVFLSHTLLFSKYKLYLFMCPMFLRMYRQRSIRFQQNDLESFAGFYLLYFCISCVSCITGGFFTTEPSGKPWTCFIAKNKNPSIYVYYRF